MSNLPSDISENIAKFAYNYHYDMATQDRVLSDLLKDGIESILSMQNTLLIWNILFMRYVCPILTTIGRIY